MTLSIMECVVWFVWGFFMGAGWYVANRLLSKIL